MKDIAVITGCFGVRQLAAALAQASLLAGMGNLRKQRERARARGKRRLGWRRKAELRPLRLHGHGCARRQPGIDPGISL